MAEENLQVAVGRLEMHREQLEALARQSEVLRLTLEEYRRAQETLRRYKDTPDDSEMLVPVGGSSFLYAKVSSPDRALVGIGSNLVLEDDVGTAVERLQRRIDYVTTAAEEVSKLLQQTNDRIQTLTKQVQEEYAKLQTQEGAQG
jgi:prefoldin alpha subunit